MEQELWYKEYDPARRFIVKITPGSNIFTKLKTFAKTENIKNAVILSAVGSVKNVTFRGVKTGAKLPITEPRISVHEVEGPLELLGLEGNIFPDENNEPDAHLHIMMAKSSGEVIGGHMYDCCVFASCEIILQELIVTGVERHISTTGGTSTIFIEGEEV